MYIVGRVFSLSGNSAKYNSRLNTDVSKNPVSPLLVMQMIIKS